MEIQEVLEDHGIRYWKAGSKNVGQGWIGVTCPFCDDKSNHCGVNLKSLRVFCLRCGNHKLTSLIEELLGVSRKEAIGIKKSLSPAEGGRLSSPSEDRLPRLPKTHLPPESTNIFPPIHKIYLKDRGFNWRYLKKKYNLKAVHVDGKYKFRIIIPIYMNHRLVAFTSRAVVEGIEPKYRLCGHEEMAIDPKKVLYNYDNIKKGRDAIAVEGPADVWRLGDGAFSTLGVKTTAGQLAVLIKKEISTLYVLFDNDAVGRGSATKFAKKLVPIARRVELLNLTEYKDPGELTPDDVRKLKRMIDFKE